MSITRGWAKRIGAAQSETTETRGGVPLRRVPFGEEAESPGYPECRDCGCRRGELHVPGCCIEACPRCGGQRIGCDCDALH